MKFTWPVYLALTAVAAASFVAAWLLPTSEIMRTVVSSPGIVALIAVIHQIFRDHAQYEHSLALQRDQQHFILGVTSHFASVAFDRHVTFCEEYISKMQAILPELMKSGPRQQCNQWASELADIRLKYRAWLTAEIQDKIIPFEKALIKIAVLSMRLADIRPGEKRSTLVEEMHEIFEQVLGLHDLGETDDEDVRSGRIMDHLQDLLGAKQLVRLRTALIDGAVKTLEKNS